jgi:PHD/YefM family antitoxin component YafN of YafNO toxin-antitoxin module
MKRGEERRAERQAPLTVRMDLSPAVIISAVQRMKKAERDEFLEDLLAAASPEFLASIREARAQYASGRTRSHEELFGR